MAHKTCTNGDKFAYSEKEVKRVRNIRGKDKKSLRYYKCQNCFYFHLTSEVEKNSKYSKPIKIEKYEY